MKISTVAGKVYGAIVAAFLVLPIGTALLVWFADGNARGRFDNAKVISTRYILSVVLLMVLLVPFFIVADRRKAGASLTWGEAMVAAVYVFLLLFWLYGVVPHEFLNWADAELAWRPDKIIIGHGSTWTWWKALQSFPIVIHKQILRDVLAVVLYVVGLGGFIWACSFWNKRNEPTKAVETTSAYGRPLVTGRS
ncbi:MAG: hypothetical protein R2698_05630 [Microthrixaceae bacterium]